MRTRFKPALAHRMDVVPAIHTPRNTNFICGGPPDQKTVTYPKAGIQIAGNKNFAQNVQADDRVLSCTTLPCFS
jgi:hypothetical protein